MTVDSRPQAGTGHRPLSGPCPARISAYEALRPWKEVLSDWAREVASKLERPEAELLARGLSATDFSLSQAVEVRLTGVTHRFNSAFAVIRPKTGEVAVFSEHAGYVEFHLSEDDVVAEIAEEIYRHEA